MLLDVVEWCCRVMLLSDVGGVVLLWMGDVVGWYCWVVLLIGVVGGVVGCCWWVV